MTKACWMITTGRLLGAVLDYKEALAAARVIWPGAEVR